MKIGSASGFAVGLVATVDMVELGGGYIVLAIGLKLSPSGESFRFFSWRVPGIVTRCVSEGKQG